MTGMKTILCMKWGTQYGVDFVNQLYNGVKANITGDFRFVCLCDNADGLNPAIDALPLPDIKLGDAREFTGWRKLSSLSPQLTKPPYNMSGTIMFFDIDMIITDNIDDLWTFEPGKFCIIENWTQQGRGIGNSSVYRYELEQMHDIFHDFDARYNDIYKEYDNEQMYLTAMVAKQQDVKWWPEAWCKSFKIHCMPPRLLRGLFSPKMPENCKILVFHGPPKPTDAAIGKWVKHNGQKRMMRPAKWITDLWNPKIS
jgi:hypothetical protein